MESFPLLRYFEADDALAWRNGDRLSALVFLESARQLAARLPARRHVLNLCDDRYHFLLGWSAALLARQITLLPPSSAPGVVRSVHDEYRDSYCLIDNMAAPPGLQAIDVSKSPSASQQDGASARRFEIPSIPAAQLAAITFTSGSTGRPTRHAKSWGALVRGARALGQAIGFDQTARRSILGTVPPQHMFGLETTIMLPLQWGCALHAARPLLPADIAIALERTAGRRWLMTTPLQLRACAGDSAGLAGLEGVISATMPLSLELARSIEQLWATVVHEIYGCTEAGMIAIRRPAQEHRWHPFDGVRVWQEGKRTWVAGGHVGQPIALNDVIVLAADGFDLLGRIADLMKIAGKRASLQGLNHELSRVHGVLDAVFFLPEDGDRLVAFAVAPGMEAGAIIAKLRERIDPAFLPRPLYLVDALPRAATGKLTRESLRRLALDLDIKTAKLAIVAGKQVQSRPA